MPLLGIAAAGAFVLVILCSVGLPQVSIPGDMSFEIRPSFAWAAACSVFALVLALEDSPRWRAQVAVPVALVGAAIGTVAGIVAFVFLATAFGILVLSGLLSPR